MNKLIGYCNRTGLRVYESDVEGYAGVCKDSNENLHDCEFTRLTPEQKQGYEDDYLLYQLGKAPNPNAVCLEPHEVNEDNEHRVCECCGAGVLFEGFVLGGGEYYYCTIECLRTDAEKWPPQEDGSHDMRDWLTLHDADALDDDDLEYIYWTNWEGE